MLNCCICMRDLGCAVQLHTLAKMAAVFMHVIGCQPIVNLSMSA